MILINSNKMTLTLAHMDRRFHHFPFRWCCFYSPAVSVPAIASYSLWHEYLIPLAPSLVVRPATNLVKEEAPAAAAETYPSVSVSVGPLFRHLVFCDRVPYPTWPPCHHVIAVCVRGTSGLEIAIAGDHIYWDSWGFDELANADCALTLTINENK